MPINLRIIMQIESKLTLFKFVRIEKYKELYPLEV